MMTNTNNNAMQTPATNGTMTVTVPGLAAVIQQAADAAMFTYGRRAWKRLGTKEAAQIAMIKKFGADVSVQRIAAIL